MPFVAALGATVIFTVLRTIRAKRRRVGFRTEIIRTAPEP
jgi:hypothetical protein